MDRYYPEAPEEEEEPEEEGSADEHVYCFIMGGEQIFTKLYPLAHSAMDRKGKRAGCVELS